QRGRRGGIVHGGADFVDEREGWSADRGGGVVPAAERARAVRAGRGGGGAGLLCAAAADGLESTGGADEDAGRVQGPERGVKREWPSEPCGRLSVVAVAVDRGWDGGRDGLDVASEHPSALAGREAHGQQAVVDLAGDDEAVEGGGGEEEAGVVVEAVG